MKVYKTQKGVQYYLVAHAIKRMSQRNISQAVLEDALDTYDNSEYDREGNQRLIRYQPDGRKLIVVIAKGSDPLRLITLIII